MDILAHGLWGAIGAKAANKSLARNGKSTRLDAWWTGFWGTFPDLLAFTPLAVFAVWGTFAGTTTFANPGGLTGILYPLGHSFVTWAVVFGVVWLIRRRPAWELLGWFSHIAIDIGTHPSDFYPTRFLWPLSDFHVGGIAWATPWFLAVNYVVIFGALYFLRDHQSLGDGFRAITNVRRFLAAVLALAAVGGAAVTFARRASHEPSSPTRSPAATTRIEVFFSNERFDPGIMECGRTYPVARDIAETSAVGRAALEELLKGPTVEEKAAGYFTSLNDGATVNSLVVQNGVAHADFSARLEENSGGSCRVAAIRSQIANTLKQFPTVNEVVIGVEGRVEDALQP